MLVDDIPSMQVPSPPLDDWVVEQGTSGIWTYRKWNSGIAECWGKYSGTVTYSSTSGRAVDIEQKLIALVFHLPLPMSQK